MRWTKLGLVHVPDRRQSWSRSHAMVPTPVYLPGRGVIRIFVTGCDADGIGRPGFVDVLPEAPTAVVNASVGALMDLGAGGTFDENGVLCTSVVRAPDGRLFMYYVGFEIGTRIRYRLLTGLATSEDDGLTFERHSVTPILERSPNELYFRGGPFVRIDDGRFRMWYVAGSTWLDVGGKAMPEYRVKYLESADGMTWGASGRTVLDITEADEHGFGRPWVTGDAGAYDMFYSVRRKSLGAYRMGHAVSADGVRWERRDAQLGLDVEPGAFDSEAIMYAAVINTPAGTICYYNGNDFGREGFGAARLEAR
jgi:hypothetical protein